MIASISTHENPYLRRLHPFWWRPQPKISRKVAHTHTHTHTRYKVTRVKKNWWDRNPKVKLGGAFHVGVEVDGIEWPTSRVKRRKDMVMVWRPPGKKRCKTQQKPKPNFVLRFVQMKFFGFQKKIGIRGWKQLPPLPKDKTSLSPAWGWWKVWPTVWL